MDRERERAEARVGANVARRLLATDMLLSSGERENEAAPSLGVHRLAGETPRHLAHTLGARREQSYVRAAEIKRVAEPLAFSDCDVGVHLARRPHGGEGHRI